MGSTVASNGKPKKQRRNATYSFRPGSRVSGVKPDVAGRELNRIRASEGELTPEKVLESAEDPASPLHPYFEWDNDKAANEHRLWQARALIRSIEVRYANDQDPMPVYVHVRTAETCAYQPIAVVARDPDLVASATCELQEKLASARQSLNGLRRALAIHRGQLPEQVETVSRHLEAASQAVSEIG